MRKMSDTMIAALTHVARYGQYATTDRATTQKALSDRDAVVVSTGFTARTVQVTEAGWTALPTNVRTMIVSEACAAATLETDMFAPFDAGNAVADDVAEQAATAAQVRDARLVAAGFEWATDAAQDQADAFNAATDVVNATTPVTISEPDYAAAIATEMGVNARVDGKEVPSATQEARNAALLVADEPVPAVSVVRHGPRHFFSRLMAECYCGELLFAMGPAEDMVHLDDANAVALKPGTSVVTRHGATGRVISQSTKVPTVTVRMHAVHGEPDTQEFARGDVRTVVDLWAQLLDLCSNDRYPSLFHVTDRAYVAKPGNELARSLSWSDVHMADSKGEPTYSEYYLWHESEEDSSPLVRFAMLAGYGDYTNASTWDASNYRVITSTFGGASLADPLTFDVGHSTHDGLGVAIRIGDPRWTVGDLSTVVDWMYGLEDCPVIDEEDLSAYESELAHEWWDNGGRSDTLSTVDALLPGDTEWDDAPLNMEFVKAQNMSSLDRDDMIRGLLYEQAEWNYESSTSVSMANFDDIVSAIMSDLYATDQITTCACGKEVRVLPNATVARHADPSTARHCHQSGTLARYV
jgi:hypothetical protein